ncbi:MAG: helix-turn-helix transcriptional regulator [Pyrobaculum sp.]
MKLVIYITFAVALAFLLDYIHVMTMASMHPSSTIPYPTPMLYIFLLFTSIIVYLLLRPRQGRVEKVVDQLLREPDRSIYLKIYERGEVSVAEVAKELGLNKVKAWRAAQRLKDRGLIDLEKKAGRLVARLRTAKGQ